MYELDVVGEHGHWNRCAVGGERVLRRDENGARHRPQPFARELRGRGPQGRYDAECAAAVEHRLDHGTRLDIEPQQGCGEFLLEGRHGSGERRQRIYNVDGDAQFRFKPTGQALRPRLEEVYVARHRACIGEQRAALIGQHRNTSAAIEELHTELPFQIREGLAHYGLGTPQAAPGRREAAFIRRGDEGAELVE